MGRSLVTVSPPQPLVAKTSVSGAEEAAAIATIPTAISAKPTQSPAAMAMVSPSRHTGTRSRVGSLVSNWYMKLVSLSGSQTTWLMSFFLSSATTEAGCRITS